MTDIGYALFDTAIGPCGIAWGARSTVGLQLPETNRSQVHHRLLQRFPAAQETSPPPDAQAVIKAITALLRGEAVDLSDVPLDMDSVPEFNRYVYEIARAVPPGATITYGEIARLLGDPAAARAVGKALGQNPFPIVVPCHRVLAANGKIGGFSANGGVSTKRRLLAIESVHAKGEPRLFDSSDAPASG